MQRHERLEQDSKIALSDIIMHQVKNTSVTGIISVTDVKITPDQKYAKVYLSIFGKVNKEKVIESLNSAKGFIRSSLGRHVRFRNVPALTFVIDDSLEYGSHMDKVIDEVMKNDNNNK